MSTKLMVAMEDSVVVFESSKTGRKKIHESLKGIIHNALHLTMTIQIVHTVAHESCSWILMVIVAQVHLMSRRFHSFCFFIFRYASGATTVNAPASKASGIDKYIACL